MPHSHNLCPDPTLPAAVPVESCLDCSRTRLDRQCPWTTTLLTLMRGDDRPRISPSRLAVCPRQIALKQRYDYPLDPKEMFPAARGQIWHAGLEALEQHGITEVELEREWNGVTIHGRLDCVYPELGLLVDYKTMAYVATGGRTQKDGTVSQPTTPTAGHVAQLSLYAWLARDGYQVFEICGQPDKQPIQWDITRAEVVFLDHGKSRRVGVQLWGEGMVDTYLELRVPQLQKAYRVDEPLAPVLTPDDGDFEQCSLCPVKDICAQLAEEGR